jgi:nucleoside-diphosphate-sugar epimerase
MSNKLHVVFGSGPVGMAVIQELLANEKRVRLVKRSGQAQVSPLVEVVKGDATDVASTRDVCKGAAVVYNCTNPKDYHKWPAQFPPLQRGVLEGAAANNAKLVVMDNLYMYGPHDGITMTEDLPYNGKGSRSTTRAMMARELEAAHASGKVRAVSARASDFFGPGVKQALMGQHVFRSAMQGKPAQLLLNVDQPHTYTYVPDIGKALVLLGDHDEALGQVWHIPSPETVTTREFLEMVYEEAGRPLNLMIAPKWMVQIMSLIVPQLRGFAENFYQIEEPYILDHSKFERTFGSIATPLRAAIRTTLHWCKDHPDG